MAKPLRLTFVLRIPEGEDREFERRARLAKELGYWGVEPAVRDPDAIRAEYALGAIQDAGLGISAIATGLGYVADRLSLTDTRPEVRVAALGRLRSQVDLGRSWNTNIILGSMRGSVQAGADRVETLEWLACGLRDLSGCLGGSVNLHLEAINRYETNIANTADEAIGLIESAKAPGVRLLLDTFHMNIEESSPHDSVRRSSRHLGHFHFSDSNRCAPGMGHIDFRKWAATLSETGYDGCVAVEVLEKPDFESSMRLSMEHLRGIGVSVS